MTRLFGLAVSIVVAVLLLGGAAQVRAQSTSFGDGTYFVGSDIQPGTYRSSSSTGCYWERESGFSGSLGDVIANNFVNASTVVTIASTDRGFKSDGCGLWSPAISAITASPTAPFADGTYLVGVDIAPGTWRAPGGGDCYWQRLSGFGGTLDEIIANDDPNGSVIVTIAPGDTGFSSSGCGSWSKVQ